MVKKKTPYIGKDTYPGKDSLYVRAERQEMGYAVCIGLRILIRQPRFAIRRLKSVKNLQKITQVPSMSCCGGLS